MFDTIESSLATMSMAAGILAALAFIAGVIIFWSHLPKNGNPGEDISGDYRDLIEDGNGRHRA